MLEYTYGSDNGKGTVTYRSKPKLVPKPKPKPKLIPKTKPQPELQHTEPVVQTPVVPDTPQYLMHGRDSEGRPQMCQKCFELEHALKLHASGH